MKDRKMTFKYFTITGYQKEEQYLSNMHADGWALSYITLPGFYHFTRCTPEAVKYQIDFNQEGVAHREQYEQVFRDCGWTYIFDFVGFSYFRKPVRDMQGDESIFCDDESRFELMRRIFRGRVVSLLAIFFCTVLPQLFLNALGHTAGAASFPLSVLFFLLFILYLLIFVSFGVSYYQYEKRVRKGRWWVKYIALLLMLVVMTGLVCGAMYTAIVRRSGEYAENNDYTLRKWEDGHSIGMNNMNDTFSREYDLKKGDVLLIEYVVMRGEVRIVVEGPQMGPVFDEGLQKEPVFAEELEESGEIRVEMKEDGCYRISCAGKRAEGSIEFVIR